MHIQQEAPDKHTIQSYTDTSITVNTVLYQHSVIVSPTLIIDDWPVHTLAALNETSLEPLRHGHPEIIIIGIHQPKAPLPLALIAQLSKERIGIECMSIGAACRTFNVLLGEQRRVVVGIILAA